MGLLLRVVEIMIFSPLFTGFESITSKSYSEHEIEKWKNTTYRTYMQLNNQLFNNSYST